MAFDPLSKLTATGRGTDTVQSAIALASSKTGINFSYLLGQAQVESGMRANAAAGTSSARGLYQFIEQSWLRVVKDHGSEHGLGWAADSIKTTSSGKMTVSDPAIRRAILGLRNDPQAASLMAAEHASDNKAAIERATGRDATGTDLYMAHFLGLGGARKFLSAMETNPDRSGAAMFPAAARANRNVFYASNGQPRSLEQIYSRFAAKLDKGAASAGAVGLASARLDAAGMALIDGDTTIIPGTGESGRSASAWARATLDQLNGASQTDSASLMRPKPETARLAYMMLASLGG